MKKLLLYLFSAVLLFSFEPKSHIKIKKFTVKKVTIIAHWLSQSKACGAERDAFFTKVEVDFIAAIGFDHNRVDFVPIVSKT